MRIFCECYKPQECDRCDGKSYVEFKDFLLENLPESLFGNPALLERVNIDPRTLDVWCKQPCSYCDGSRVDTSNSGPVFLEKCVACSGTGFFQKYLGNLEISITENKLRDVIKDLLHSLQTIPHENIQERLIIKVKLDVLGEIMESLNN